MSQDQAEDCAAAAELAAPEEVDGVLLCLPVGLELDEKGAT